MTRTVGRKIRPGERRRFLCDMCSALRDKRELTRNAAGLWQCSCVGRERDAVTLTRGNAENLRAYAQRLRVPAEQAGLYPDDGVTPIVSQTSGILAEDLTPITAEDGVFIHSG